MNEMNVPQDRIEDPARDFWANSPDPQLIADLSGKILFADQTLCQLLGYAPEEIMGRSIRVFLHRDDLAMTQKRFSELREKDSIYAFPGRLIAKNRHTWYLEWNAVRAGERIYAAGRDISRRNDREKRLLSIAFRDPLTRLFNRRYVEEWLTDLLIEGGPQAEMLSMISLDLDHFKSVNDTWGHDVGDEVLMSVARVMRKSFRKTDVVARYGGEEFLILLPGTGIARAMTAANQLRSAISSMQHAKAGSVTVSIGVAQRKKDESFHSWYRRADAGVYEAKHLGRDRVVCYDEEYEKRSSSRMRISWKEELTTGHPLIDAEHRELVRLGEKLMRSSFSARTTEKAARTLDEIVRKVNKHFDDELLVLAEYGYDDYDGHRRIHAEILEKISYVYESFRNDKIRSSSFFQYLFIDVIIVHLMTEDVKYIPFLRDQMAVRGLLSQSATTSGEI